MNKSGGIRKTFLYNMLLANVRSHNKIALAVISFRIIALLITESKTAHSQFKQDSNQTEFIFDI